MISSQRRAIFIVAISFAAAGAVFAYGAGRNTLNLAVQLIASGASVALTYLLVVLYGEQKKLLERQLEIRERPEVYVPAQTVEWDEHNIEFDVHNDGDSTARQLRLEQRIEVSRLGHFHNVFDGIMTPLERMEEHEGYDDVSGWTPGRRFVKPGESESIRIDTASVEPKSFDFENIRLRLLGISPQIERYNFSISWYLMYNYRGGESDEVRVVSQSYQSDDSDGVVKTVTEQLPTPQVHLHEDWTLRFVKTLCDVADISITDAPWFLYRMYINPIPDEQIREVGDRMEQSTVNDKSSTDSDSDDDE